MSEKMIRDNRLADKIEKRFKNDPIGSRELILKYLGHSDCKTVNDFIEYFCTS
uniref:Uncharacterized protein n=1 Tax=viral metagenome TaxID=1070528 RepID=A0A6C0JSF9_9ZZZZ